jgi:hypothetical protein
MRKQQQFVRGTIYQSRSPAGNEAKLEHLGNFKLNGDKVLMFKLIPAGSKKKRR